MDDGEKEISNRVYKAWVRALDEIEEKDKKIERLRKALEFYATGKHLNLSDNEYETGAVALQALKE